jgi:hypothetical protein
MGAWGMEHGEQFRISKFKNRKEKFAIRNPQ